MRAQTIEINLVKYLRPAKCCKQKIKKKTFQVKKINQDIILNTTTQDPLTNQHKKKIIKKIMQHK